MNAIFDQYHSESSNFQSQSVPVSIHGPDPVEHPPQAISGNRAEGTKADGFEG
jgi:hypothetical protein